MTTANKITVFRMLMVPVFVILLYLDLPSAGYWALGVFILSDSSCYHDRLVRHGVFHPNSGCIEGI